MPQKQFMLLFWFCVGLILFAMIHTTLFFFIKIPQENVALVQGNNTFWLGSACTLAIGFMIGSSSSKRHPMNEDGRERIDADITIKNGGQDATGSD